MKKKPYLPTRMPERVLWLNTFSAKLAVHAATLGITPVELALIVVMAAFYSYIAALIGLSRTFTQNLTEYKNRLSHAPLGSVLGAVPSLAIPVAPAPPASIGIFTYISGLVQRIKGHPDYTVAIGEDLGVIGDEQPPFDQDNFIPAGKAESFTGYVKISFDKDQCDSVHIYTLDTGTPVYLANDTETPYHDTRALAVPGQPENRKYQLRGVLHDIEIGHPGDTINVTFGG
ncbi:MAG TPA: hypothetical protein VI757_01430 [Bacteroidia bacterium]|nr:hypothetical protein [Bacteroidia bacterium]